MYGANSMILKYNRCELAMAHQAEKKASVTHVTLMSSGTYWVTYPLETSTDPPSHGSTNRKLIFQPLPGSIQLLVSTGDSSAVVLPLLHGRNAAETISSPHLPP